MAFTKAGLWGPDAVLDSAGHPQPGATAAVYLSDGVTLAGLWTTSAKSVALTNPTQADIHGNLHFYADPGPYVLKITVGGTVTTLTVEVPIDPGEAAQDQDVVAAQAAAEAYADGIVAAALAAALAASQPLDADLTAIAALATTAFGRALLILADAAALRAAAGLGTAATHAVGDFDAAGTAAAAVAAVVAGAPGALDTLNELATALADDANFATTVTNALATKVIAGATSGSANQAALPAAVAHTHEMVKTDDGGVYLSTGSSWVQLVAPNGTYALLLTGLDATGATDCTATVQAAMNAATAAGGGIIRIPAGSFKLTTHLIPVSNVRIEGSGMGITKLLPIQECFYFSTGSTSAPLTEFHLSDLTIDCSNQPVASNVKGIHAQYLRRCSFTRVRVLNSRESGIGVDFLQDCVISHCVTENTGLDNTGSQASGNGIGIGQGGWTDSEEFLVVGCSAINAKRWGIMLEGGDTTTGGKFIGNSARACGSGGFGIGGGTASLWEGNTAEANTGPGFTIGTLTVSSSLAPTIATIQGNVSRLNGSHGIYYDASTHRPNGGYVQILNNVVEENVDRGIYININLTLISAQGQIAGLKVDGNTIYKNGTAGVEIISTGSGSFQPLAWRFNNNHIDENIFTSGSYQFRVACSLTGSEISHNTFYHHTTAAGKTGIYVGYGGAAITLTGCRISGNTSANAGNPVLAIDAAATVDSTTVVEQNQPDAGSPAPKTVTANYSLTSADSTLVTNIATNGLVYLPPAATAGKGRQYTVKNISAAPVEVRVSDATSIDGNIGEWIGKYGSATFTSDGTTWYKTGSFLAGTGFARRTTDATAVNNSTVLVTDDQLTVPVEPNAVYQLDAFVIFDASQTSDFKVGWSLPSGASISYNAPGLTTSISGTTAGSMISGVTTTTQNMGADAVGVNQAVRIVGLIKTGASSGNVALQYAQVTADATNLTVHTDSWMRLTRVS